MAAGLARRLRDVGCQPQVASRGLVVGGYPATANTVRILAERGFDVSDHRSRLVDESIVVFADLILCAERDHVVAIAGRYPGSFGRTFTMPEFVRLTERVGPVHDDLPGWLSRVAQQRPSGMDYLDTDPARVGEIVDPTGCPPSVWAEVVRHIDDMAVRIARVMAP